MTNIKNKFCKIILLIFMIQIIFAFENISRAERVIQNEGNQKITWGDIINSADDFLNQGKETAEKGEISIELEDGKETTISTPNDFQLKNLINDIFNILFPLGVAVTVIIGGALGIEFMVSSAEDKAKVKESLVPYVAGCIVIYGAFGIWKLAITIFSAIG